MPEELLLRAPRSLHLGHYREKPLAPDEVRARALMSAVSHGTELSLYRGSSAFHQRRFDPARRLFIDAPAEQTYPARLGYEWVGTVTEVGPDVRDYRPGNRVHLPRPHRETQTFAPTETATLGVAGPLPPDLPAERALFLESLSIALQAVHDAGIKIGDHVVIFGLGVLGLLALRLARRAGAGHLDAADPLPGRRTLATVWGADRVHDPAAADIGLALKTGRAGADVAIEFSGRYEALHAAIRCVRPGGLVVAAGFYQGGGTALRLGEEWLHNRVSMVASSRGWGSSHRDHPRWDRARLRGTALGLLLDPELALESLVSHRFPFSRAADAYALLDEGRDDVLKMIFTYV